MCMSYSAPADREQFLMHDEQKHEWDIDIKYCKKPNLKDVKVRFVETHTYIAIHYLCRCGDSFISACKRRVHANNDENDVCLFLLFVVVHARTKSRTE